MGTEYVCKYVCRLMMAIAMVTTTVMRRKIQFPLHRLYSPFFFFFCLSSPFVSYMFCCWFFSLFLFSVSCFFWSHQPPFLDPEKNVSKEIKIPEKYTSVLPNPYQISCTFVSCKTNRTKTSAKIHISSVVLSSSWSFLIISFVCGMKSIICT